MKRRENQWPMAGSELWERFKNAIKSIKFLSYFVGVILVLSGAGVWLPFVLESFDDASKTYFQNVFTFSVAILGALYMESLNSNNDRSILKIPALLIGIFSIILLLIGTFSENFQEYSLSSYGMLMALVLYFLVYANNDAFDEVGIAKNRGYKDASEDKLLDGEDI